MQKMLRSILNKHALRIHLSKRSPQRPPTQQKTLSILLQQQSSSKFENHSSSQRQQPQQRQHLNRENVTTKSKSLFDRKQPAPPSPTTSFTESMEIATKTLLQKNQLFAALALYDQLTTSSNDIEGKEKQKFQPTLYHCHILLKALCAEYGSPRRCAVQKNEKFSSTVDETTEGGGIPSEMSNEYLQHYATRILKDSLSEARSYSKSTMTKNHDDNVEKIENEEEEVAPIIRKSNFKLTNFVNWARVCCDNDELLIPMFQQCLHHMGFNVHFVENQRYVSPGYMQSGGPQIIDDMLRLRAKSSPKEFCFVVKYVLKRTQRAMANQTLDMNVLPRQTLLIYKAFKAILYHFLPKPASLIPTTHRVDEQRATVARKANIMVDGESMITKEEMHDLVRVLAQCATWSRSASLIRLVVTDIEKFDLWDHLTMEEVVSILRGFSAIPDTSTTEALQFFNRKELKCKESGQPFEMTADLYAVLIKLHSKSKENDARKMCNKLLKEMMDVHNFKVPPSVFLSILKLTMDLQRYSQVFYIFDSVRNYLHRHGQHPDIRLWKLVFNCCFLTEDIQRATTYFNLASTDGDLTKDLVVFYANNFRSRKPLLAKSQLEHLLFKSKSIDAWMYSPEIIQIYLGLINDQSQFTKQSNELLSAIAKYSKTDKNTTIDLAQIENVIQQETKRLSDRKVVNLHKVTTNK